MRPLKIQVSMKLKNLFEHMANVISGGFITTPQNIDDLQKRDFVDKAFELEFLGNLKFRNDNSPQNPGVPLDPMSYVDMNRIQNLQNAGLVKILQADGKWVAFITRRGCEWVQTFDDAKQNVAGPITAGPAINIAIGVHAR